MKFPAILVLSSVFALVFVSCANDDEETIPVDKTAAMLPTKLVGRVASVPSDKRFVLIQSYGQWNISPGTILTTRGPDDRTANLLVTGEALGQYAAADLQAGTLQVGDGVYSRETPKPVAAPPPSIESIDGKSTRPF